MIYRTDSYKREIIYAFDGLFREIFNIVELALDKEKAEIAKDLIGNKLKNTKEKLLNSVDTWFAEVGISGQTDNPPTE